MIRFACLCLLLGCARPVAPAASPNAAETAIDPLAAAGVTDPGLARLLTDHWRWQLVRSPEEATWLGIRGYDDRVRDSSLAAAEAAEQAVADFLARARALSRDGLGDDDRLFLGLFEGNLEADVASAACRFERWSLSPRANVMADLFSVLDVQPLDDLEGVQTGLRRVRAWADMVPARVAALRAGAAEGLVANHTSISLVIEMVDTQLAAPNAQWPPLQRSLPDDAVAAAWRQALSDEIDASVRPALKAWRDVLEDELLPRAPRDERPGLAGLPLPEACYAARIRSYTTLDRSAREVHALGLAELERIHAAFRALGPRTVGTADLTVIFRALREDPALHFTSGPEIVAKAEEALARAQAAVPDWFGVVPVTPCEVVEIPAYEAPYTTIAYYRPPPRDDSRPGQYFVNTYEPTTRPRHEAEVLAFHESVPGHHLQIARAQELPELPAFHRYGGYTAFVEGWALYVERLADEMGLYSGDVDRLGMLSFDAWRASRLVVDTGLHALGWSREQAVRFMLDNTPLAENNVRNEVDRYVTWPGQALAYKSGQIEILALRREAEEALGDAFSIQAFHDVVLGRGALPLPVLRQQVQDWVAEVQGNVPRP